VLAISHDRYFLDVMCQRCIEISDGRAELYSGNYSFYVEERQRRFEEKLKKYEKDQAKVEQLTRAAEQMHLWAFMGADKLHKRAFSMEKRIEKLQTSEKPTVARKLTVKFKEREFSGDEVLVVDSVSKAFGEKKLFSDLSLTVTGGERIALIGDNGTGKSTLIKMIMHDEAPDAGILYTGPAVRTGYLPQIVEFSDMSRTCLDTMLYDCRCQPQEARDRLAAFGFRGEDVLIPVSALSGGERSRLKLCMVMGGDINFLILDEPTNHLDISSREWMEDAISDYTQALLFVSHDRYFIEKFATRVWALENGALTDFRGSFSQYREYVARQQVFAKNEKTSVREKAPRRRPPNTAKRLERLEKDIEKAEERISELDALAEENGSDYQKLMEIGGEKTALEGELEELYRQWEELSD
jgi:ATPase subunit of ABC transporter with duplicated ATPase domains